MVERRNTSRRRRKEEIALLFYLLVEPSERFRLESIFTVSLHCSGSNLNKIIIIIVS